MGEHSPPCSLDWDWACTADNMHACCWIALYITPRRSHRPAAALPARLTTLQLMKRGLISIRILVSRVCMLSTCITTSCSYTGQQHCGNKYERWLEGLELSGIK